MTVKSLRPAQAAELLGIGVSTLWRWSRGPDKPDFPRPIHLSARCTVFDADALLAWRDARDRPQPKQKKAAR
jgi:prophage regulatory protein